MKKQTLAYLLITFTISWTEQYFIIKGDGIQNPSRAFALMWTPGLVGIACSLFFNRNVKPLAFKMPSLKSLGIAYFTPALAAVLIILLIVICGITEYQFNPTLIEKKRRTIWCLNCRPGDGSNPWYDRAYRKSFG
jgi:hypothetical protein